jgi:conjugal transfer ATP-binding protein TraC
MDGPMSMQPLSAVRGLWHSTVARVSSAILDDIPPAERYRTHAGEVDTLTSKAMRAMAERETLASLLPYQSWDPKRQLYFNRDSVGFVLHAAPATGLSETDLQVLGGIFREKHPAGTIIQVSLIADPHVERTLERWLTADGRAAPRTDNLLDAMAKNRVNYLRQGKWRSLFSDQSSMLRMYRLVISYTVPLDAAHGLDISEASLDATERMRDAFVGVLRSAHINAEVMQPQRFVTLLSGLLNPCDDAPPQLSYDPLNPLNAQIVDPDTALLLGPGASSLVHKGVPYTLMSYVVRQFPEMWCGARNDELAGSFTSNTQRMPCPFWLTFVVRVPDALASQAMVTNKSARATQMATSPVAKYVPQWQLRKRDWDHVKRLMDNGDELLRGFFQVILLAPEGEEKRCEQELKSTYSALGWKLSKNRYAPLHGLLASLPMGICRDTDRALEVFGSYRSMTGASCANVAPWSAEWIGTKTPTLLLVGRRGQLVFWDPFDNDRGNYNIACCATPGAGKSFFTQEWIFSCLRAGGLAYVIDAGHSYRNLCEVFGGTYIDFGDAQRQMRLNPFSSIRSDDDEFLKDQMPLLKLLFAQMASHNKPLDQKGNAILERAILQAWQARRNEATVDTVVEALRDNKTEHERLHDTAADIATMLYSYTSKGTYGTYFTGESNIDLDSSFVVLDLDALNRTPDLQAVVLRILMMRITQAMYLSGNKTRRKLCIIDEAWRLMRMGSTGDFIEEGFRVARKHGGSFMTVTQHISDWFQSETAKASYMCSDFTCFLRQQSTQVTTAKEKGYIDDSDGKVALLLGLDTVRGKYSEIAINTPTGITVTRLIVDPWTEKVYSTAPEEIDFIREQKRRGVPLMQAVDQLVQSSTRR